MPLTASHAVAVLPLRHLGLSASGLVIGSMVPDVPLYLPFLSSTARTHSLVGAISVDLIMGITIFVVWHALIAPAFVALAPEFIRSRLPSTVPSGLRVQIGTLRGVALVVISLILGALTHVVWDSFTHRGVWSTELVPMLSEQFGPLAGYEWAQHVSSVGGLLLLSVWVYRRPRSTTPHPVTGQRSFIIGARTLLIAVTAAGSAAGLVSVVRRGGRIPVQDLLFRTITWGTVAACAGAIIVATVWQLGSRTRSSV